MRRWFRDNGLTVVVLTLFAIFWMGQAATGWSEKNRESLEQGEPPVGFPEYLRSGHFLSVTAENWESEFLQMPMYVVFTTFLYQRGSSESKDPDPDAEYDPVDRDPRLSRRPDAPWPVRRGGIALAIYQYSLSLAFLALFLLSFALHATGSLRDLKSELQAKGEPVESMSEYLRSARLWHESFQNWQSEFLSLGAMAVLSIYLRHKGSPESKPVDAPHRQTGSD